MPRSARSFSSLATRSSSVSKSARDTGAGVAEGTGAAPGKMDDCFPAAAFAAAFAALLALKFERAKRLRGLLCHPLVVLFLGGEILPPKPRLSWATTPSSAASTWTRQVAAGSNARASVFWTSPCLDLRHPGDTGAAIALLFGFAEEVSRTRVPDSPSPRRPRPSPRRLRTRPPTTRTRPPTTRDPAPDGPDLPRRRSSPQPPPRPGSPHAITLRDVRLRHGEVQRHGHAGSVSGGPGGAAPGTCTHWNGHDARPRKFRCWPRYRRRPPRRGTPPPRATPRRR